ncbi:hypothetical protein SAY87_003502 [Trapa incisa]|uniref:Uncharacterized protein n=1 Tax=Trapa incisa TaxID=236973 RepID=A0AAN7QHT2_9MYRT|nr:hypothetical protein SAY87_003502 [Trapa incisa]
MDYPSQVLRIYKGRTCRRVLMVAWLLWSISHGRFPSPRILINPYIKDSPFHRVNGLHNIPTIRVGNGAGPIMGIHAGPCKGDSNLPDRSVEESY